MSDPLAVQVAQSFQSQLLGANQEVILAMTRRWQAVEAGLTSEIEALAKEIDLLRQKGEAVPAWKIYELGRYQSLLAQIQTQLSQYMQWAIIQLEGDALKAQETAKAHAQEMLGVLAGSEYGRLKTAFDQLSVSPAEKITALAQGGQPLDQILSSAYPAAVNALTNKLIQGAALGWNPRKTAREMLRNGGLDTALNHLLLVARDQQIRNYRESQRDAYRSSGVVYGYKRLASKNKRTCMACLTLDGTIYPTGQVMPLHPQDRCTMIPLIVGRPEPKWKTGLEWFREQTPADQQEMMGPERYRLWRDGLFELEKIVTIKPNPVWGPSAQVTSAKALRQGTGGGGLGAIGQTTAGELLKNHLASQPAGAQKKTIALQKNDPLLAELTGLLPQAKHLNLSTKQGINNVLKAAAAGDEAYTYTDEQGRLSGAISWHTYANNVQYTQVTGAGFATPETNLTALQDVAKIAQTKGRGLVVNVPNSLKEQYLSWGFVVKKGGQSSSQLALEGADVGEFLTNPLLLGQKKPQQLAAEYQQRLNDPAAAVTFRTSQPVPAVGYTPTQLDPAEVQSLTKEMVEPPLKPIPGKHVSAGMLLIDPKTGKLVLVNPAGGFGAKTTIPKGTVEKGEGLQETAIREVFEETGFKAKIVGYLGDYEKSTSVNRLYVGVVQDGAPWMAHWETEAVQLVPIEEARKFVDTSEDKTILKEFEELYQQAMATGLDLEAGLDKVTAEKAEQQALAQNALQQYTAGEILSLEELRLAYQAAGEGQKVNIREDIAYAKALEAEAKAEQKAEAEKAEALYSTFTNQGLSALDVATMQDLRSLISWAYETGQEAHNIADLEAVYSGRAEQKLLQAKVAFPAELAGASKGALVDFLVQETGAVKWKLAQLSKPQIEALAGQTKEAILQAAEEGKAVNYAIKGKKTVEQAEVAPVIPVVTLPANLLGAGKGQLVNFFVQETGVAKWKLAVMTKEQVEALSGLTKEEILAAGDAAGLAHSDKYKQAKKAPTSAGQALKAGEVLTSKLLKDKRAVAAWLGVAPSELEGVNLSSLLGLTKGQILAGLQEAKAEEEAPAVVQVVADKPAGPSPEKALATLKNLYLKETENEGIPEGLEVAFLASKMSVAELEAAKEVAEVKWLKLIDEVLAHKNPAGAVNPDPLDPQNALDAVIKAFNTSEDLDGILALVTVPQLQAALKVAPVAWEGMIAEALEKKLAEATPDPDASFKLFQKLGNSVAGDEKPYIAARMTLAQLEAALSVAPLFTKGFIGEVIKFKQASLEPTPAGAKPDPQAALDHVMQLLGDIEDINQAQVYASEKASLPELEAALTLASPFMKEVISNVIQLKKNQPQSAPAVVDPQTSFELFKELSNDGEQTDDVFLTVVQNMTFAQLEAAFSVAPSEYKHVIKEVVLFKQKTSAPTTAGPSQPKTLEVTGATQAYMEELKAKAALSFSGTSLAGATKALNNIQAGSKGLVYLDEQGQMVGVVSLINYGAVLKVGGATFKNAETNAQAIADAIKMAGELGVTLETWVPTQYQVQYTAWGFKNTTSNYYQLDPKKAPAELIQQASPQITLQTDKAPISLPAGTTSMAEASKLSKATLLAHIAQESGLSKEKLNKLDKEELLRLIGQQAGSKLDALIAQKEEKATLTGFFNKWQEGGNEAIKSSQQGYKVLEYLQKYGTAGVTSTEIEALRVHVETLAEEERKSSPYNPRFQKRPLPILPAAAKLPEHKEFPADLKKLKVVKKLGGSTGAELVQAPDGKLYVRKKGANAGHVREEAYADAAYQAMGLNVPRFQLYETAEGPVKLAEYVEGQTLNSFLNSASAGERKKVLAQLRQGFTADALMGNWDVLGADRDNVLVDKDGRVWRIDNGGSLRYRAMGGQKEGPDWNGYVTELWTMRESGRGGAGEHNATFFGEMDMYEIMEQAKEVVRKGDAVLASVPAEVREVLHGRLEYLRDMTQVSDTLRKDTFVPEYTDSFLKHSTYMRQEGMMSKLPKMTQAQEGSVVVKDENGKEWDNWRGRGSHMEALENYIRAAGGNPDFLPEFMGRQAQDSWEFDETNAVKYYMALSRGGNFDDYYWYSGVQRAKQGYEAMTQKWGKKTFNITWEAFHAFNFEVMRNMDFERNHPEGGFVEIVRTESQGTLDHYGVKKSYSKAHRFKRGLAESGSLYRAIKAVAGTQMTMQRVPYHRIFGFYFMSRGSKTTHTAFLGESENEILFDSSGLDIYYVGSYTGPVDEQWKKLDNGGK